MTVNDRTIEFWKKQALTTLKHAEELIKGYLDGVKLEGLADQVSIKPVDRPLFVPEENRIWLGERAYFAIAPERNYTGNKYWFCQRFKTSTGWGWLTLSSGENLEIVILEGLLKYTNIPGI